MNCEEFEAIGLGLEREGGVANGAQAAERAAALEHANTCSRCAALQDSWHEARLGLQALRATTQQAEAPARIEMRLRQEFRTQHRTLKMRSRLIFASWTLATAAVLFGVVSWRNWRVAHDGSHKEIVSAGSGTPSALGGSDGSNGTQGARQEAMTEGGLLADNQGDFTLLPGSLPQETQDAAIFRVRLRRGALADFGLPVNEERASDLIQVDLLVGEDGQPRAVRLPSDSSD
jgi:hypothetical protein